MKNDTLLIEPYLLGELEGQVLADFEAALASDKELSIAVVQYRQMQERLDAMRLRNKVGNAINMAGNQKSNKIFRLTMAVMAIAAVIFFAILVRNSDKAPIESEPVVPIAQEPVQSPELPQNKRADLQEQAPVIDQSRKKTAPQIDKNKAQYIALAQSYHRAPSGGLVRSSSDNLLENTAPQQAAEAYIAQNYALVIALLQDEQLLNSGDFLRNLRANAFFLNKSFTKAAVDFKYLENSFQFKFDAQWNYMLCQIALGNIDGAKNLIAEITADENHPFQEKAVALLEKI